MSYRRIESPQPNLPAYNNSYSRTTTNTHPMQGRFSNFFRPSYPAKVGNVTSARRRKLLLSYAPDWVLTLALAALFFSLDKVEGYRRVFSLEDTSLRHPYAVHERVPNLWLYIICGAVPLVALPLINFFTVRSWWDFHNSWLGLVLGLSLTGSITQFVKITVGRPRPDIVSRCMPPDGATDPPFGLTSWEICTQTENNILRDGFRSFPSGHSSMSFAGLGFLAYYLAGKLHLFDKRGHTGKAWISLAPFSAAALVAISRSMDYRHHWHDILVGSLLGTIVSFFAYRQYYPSLASELSHQPYSPRVKDPEDVSSSPSSSSGPGILPLHLGNTSSSSGYKPTQVAGGGAPLNNRYNTTPSPPPSHAPYNPQQSSTAPNPFVQPHSAPHGSTAYRPPNAAGSYELERPAQGGMHDHWKQGAGVDGTVPRGADEDEEDVEPYGGYQRETRFPPPAQQTSGLT